MVARVKEIDKGKYRFARRVGRLVARVAPGRKKEMTSASAQVALADEHNKDTAPPESNGDLVFKMQPLSRREVKVRVLAYRKAEPRFVYDEMPEETAAAG